MKILSITIEQSKTRPDILDWLTSPEIKSGKNEEKHWMVNTNVQLANPHQDKDVESLMALLFLCKLANYPLLMIKKNV